MNHLIRAKHLSRTAKFSTYKTTVRLKALYNWGNTGFEQEYVRDITRMGTNINQKNFVKKEIDQKMDT